MMNRDETWRFEPTPGVGPAKGKAAVRNRTTARRVFWGLVIRRSRRDWEYVTTTATATACRLQTAATFSVLGGFQVAEFGVAFFMVGFVFLSLFRHVDFLSILRQHYQGLGHCAR